MARRSAFSWRNPMSWLRVAALRRGLLGGSGLWTVVAALVWVPRLWRRYVSRQHEVLTTERLRPGQRISVATSPTRRGRRTR